MGRRMLDNLIRNRPGERRGGRQKGAKNKITRDRVEQELRWLAFSDPIDLFVRRPGSRTFTLRDLHAMPEEIRRCIASVKVRTQDKAGNCSQDTTVEVKLWDKVKALDLCGRALGMFTDKVELAASDGLAQAIAEGRVRAAARNRTAPR